MIVKRILFFIFVSVLPLTAYDVLKSLSLEKGEAGFGLLKIPVSPEAAAVSGAGTASEGSAHSRMDLNPAGIQQGTAGVALGRSSTFSEFESFIPSITMNLPLNESNLIFSLRYFGTDDVESRDSDKQLKTPYGFQTLHLKGAMADYVGGLSWAFGAGGVMHNIAEATYFAVSIDGGVQYSLAPWLRVGAALMNLGAWVSEPQIKGNQIYLPTEYRGGISVPLEKENWTLELMGDIRKFNEEELDIPLGLKTGYRNILFAYMGYAALRENASMSFGAGLTWKNYSVSYAFIPHYELSAGHRLAAELSY